MNAAASLTAVDAAQGQLDAYNAQDLDAYCAFFADDVVVSDLDAGVTLQGLGAFRDKYAEVFAQFPQNRVELLGRMALGQRVIDHERVLRSPQGPEFEVAAIYTFADGKIARVDFVK